MFLLSFIKLSMGYYHIPLDEYSQKLCSTIFPWGKYSYAVLPMGETCSPDIFQKIMNEILRDLSFVLVYLDNILILLDLDDNYEDHLEKLDQVLNRLCAKVFAVNIRKSFFFKEEIEYLGYLLTPKGMQPQQKKVEVIQRLLLPSNRHQLRCFLGMVNYYRDMWKCRSHVLVPLSKLAGSSTKWAWTKVEQKAFEEVKHMVAQDLFSLS